MEFGAVRKSTSRMFKVRVNRAEEGHLIVSIWRAAVAATHDFLSPADLKEIDAEAEAYLLSAARWVAVDPQDRPLAFMGLGVKRLEALFVDPQHRGKGIGRILVSFAATFVSVPGHRGERPE